MSPASMMEIAQHIGKCCDAIQQTIFGEIEAKGINKSDRPYDVSYHHGEWWVYIDVDMAAGTFDVETHNPIKHKALENALTRVRRGFSAAA